MSVDDPLDQIEREVLRLILTRIQVRARLAIERDLHELEKSAGRELPTVRAQLDQLAALPESSSFLLGDPQSEINDERRLLDDGMHPIKTGRPKKKRNAEDSDVLGTDHS